MDPQRFWGYQFVLFAVWMGALLWMPALNPGMVVAQPRITLARAFPRVTTLPGVTTPPRNTPEPSPVDDGSPQNSSSPSTPPPRDPERYEADVYFRETAAEPLGYGVQVDSPERLAWCNWDQSVVSRLHSELLSLSLTGYVDLHVTVTAAGKCEIKQVLAYGSPAFAAAVGQFFAQPDALPRPPAQTSRTGVSFDVGLGLRTWAGRNGLFSVCGSGPISHAAAELEERYNTTLHRKPLPPAGEKPTGFPMNGPTSASGKGGLDWSDPAADWADPGQPEWFGYPIPPSGEPHGLPDLVVTNIIARPPYLYVEYQNQGTGNSDSDFLVRTSNGSQSFPGNSYYRFKVPPPGVKVRTGGLTLGLIGLASGMTAEVTAEIDWEHRVEEASKDNNVFKKTITVE